MLNPTRRSILIIDDDKESLEVLREILSQEYTTYLASNGEDGVRLARSAHPDLIILDLMMPGMDGARTCQALRNYEETRNTTILVITGSAEQDPRVNAFMNGADDMVSKPYHPRELLARVHAKMRRLDPRAHITKSVIHCGNLTMDPEKFEISINHEPIAISVLEFNLLRFFLENRDRVVSRQNILDAVWKDAVVSDRTVDTHMASLRKKLVGFDHTFKTIYSAGYILKSEKPKKGSDGSPRRSSSHSSNMMK
jgi:two-component system alkaline phosphatase synthesis response regulator PhoP